MRMAGRNAQIKAVVEAKRLMNVQVEVKASVRPLKSSIALSRFSSRLIRITIDPRVLKLPKELQVYVVCHELAHFKANTPYHTSAFWKELERVFPDPQRLEEEVLRGVMA
jgi:predicted metal-dependent hydrolase